MGEKYNKKEMKMKESEEQKDLHNDPNFTNPIKWRDLIPDPYIHELHYGSDWEIDDEDDFSQLEKE